MPVGLLQCDHVPAPLLAAAGGDYDVMFQQRFQRLELRVYDCVNGEFPSQPHECDGYLVTGSRHSVYDDLAWIAHLASLVREIHAAGIPYAGVCFGHQMLAHALGGRVARSERGWGAGIHPMVVQEQLAWMDPFHSSPRSFMSCQDQIVRMPPAGHTLATGPTVAVSMMSVGSSMVGVAGHPEFTEKYAEAVYGLRRHQLGEDTHTAALGSLTEPDDGPLLADWLTNFLQS